MEKANKIPSKTRRIHNIAYIAKNLIENGFVKIGDRTFKKAVNIALSYEHGRMKSEELAFIATKLIELDKFEMVLELVPKIEQTGKKAVVIESLISRIAISDYEYKVVIFDEIIGMTEGFNYRGITQEVFIQKIASILAKDNLIDKAIELSNRLESISLRDEVLIITTSALHKTRDFDKALILAGNISNPIKRVKSLNEVSTSLLAYKDFERAKVVLIQAYEDIMSNWKDFCYRFDTLQETVYFLSVIGEYYKSIRLLILSDVHIKGKLNSYKMISLILSKNGFNDEGWEILRILS
jgi:hypothetical protein